MTCNAENDDWGIITQGSRYDGEINVVADTEAYDLTGLVFRFQLRKTDYKGEVIVTGRSDEEDPVIQLTDAEGGIVYIGIKGSDLVSLVPGGKVHMEIDAIRAADAEPEPLFTKSGFLTVKGKSILPSS